MSNSTTRARGLVSPVLGVPRVGSPEAMFSELQESVGAFRNGIDGRLAEHADELAKINSTIDSLGRAGTPGAGRGAGRAAFAEFLRSGNPQAGMRSSSGPDGGFAIPETIDAAIQDQLAEFSPLRAWATIITLGQAAGGYSFLVNRRGASSGWVGETTARPETDSPVLAKISPPEGELYANASISQWLIDDSGFNLDQFIRDNIIDEFAVQEGAAFVTGDGVVKPRGFTTYSTSADSDGVRPFGTLQYIASGAASNFATSNPADKLIDLVHAVKPAYRAGEGVGWVLNSETSATVRKFKTGAGDYLWKDGLIEGQPPMLLGYPVAIDENMPAVAADALPIAFGSWRRGYRIVDRMGTRILRDPYTNKPLVHFYTTKRVGGAVADSRAIKFLKIAAS